MTGDIFIPGRRVNKMRLKQNDPSFEVRQVRFDPRISSHKSHEHHGFMTAKVE